MVRVCALTDAFSLIHDRKKLSSLCVSHQLWNEGMVGGSVVPVCVCVCVFVCVCFCVCVSKYAHDFFVHRCVCVCVFWSEFISMPTT
jgi:hypothetical protein